MIEIRRNSFSTDKHIRLTADKKPRRATLFVALDITAEELTLDNTELMLVKLAQAMSLAKDLQSELAASVKVTHPSPTSAQGEDDTMLTSEVVVGD